MIQGKDSIEADAKDLDLKKKKKKGFDDVFFFKLFSSFNGLSRNVMKVAA